MKLVVSTTGSLACHNSFYDTYHAYSVHVCRAMSFHRAYELFYEMLDVILENVFALVYVSVWMAEKYIQAMST